ncbi:MAG: hypothetical protein MAG794_00095 [Gammaproteobacteria bacterium]|nr:hypothetical protein [Gammaproteobacteria bacterium]
MVGEASASQYGDVQSLGGLALPLPGVYGNVVPTLHGLPGDAQHIAGQAAMRKILVQAKRQPHGGVNPYGKSGPPASVPT